MDYHRSFILRFSTYEKLNLLIKKIVKGKKVNLDMISRNKYNKNFLSAQILEPATEILKIIDTFDAIKTEKNLKIYSIFSKTNVYRFIFWLIAHLGILTLLPQKILKGKFLVLKKENIPFHKNHYKYKKKKYEVVTDERLKFDIDFSTSSEKDRHVNSKDVRLCNNGYELINIPAKQLLRKAECIRRSSSTVDTNFKCDVNIYKWTKEKNFHKLS